MMLLTSTHPLSFAQERLWFLDRLEPGSTAYNVPVSLRLEGALDVPALERALGEVVRRHDTLRSTFLKVDGEPVQMVAPFMGFTLPVEDLSGLAAPEQEAEVLRLARENALRPFDLAAGPLLRATLLRVRDDDHVLLIGTHHVISDMWSLTVLLREVSVLYDAYRAGRESPLPALAIQYTDYAVRQRAELQEDVIARELAYWEARLSGAPPLIALPTDHPRPPVRSHRAACELLELPLPLLQQVQAISRRERATLFMVLLGAFQVLLSKYTGSDDIVVGTTIAGRTRTELESLIGFCANTLVLRTDVSGDPTFRDVLSRVRDVTLGAYQHQTLPFERIVAALQPERSLSHSPLFQVLFVVHQGEGPRLDLPGLQVRSVATGIETEPFDLSLALRPHAGGLRGRLSYRTDLFDSQTMVRMCGHFDQVLQQLVADPDRRLSAVTLGSAAERAHVLEAWNHTAAYQTDCAIHELIEAQAARTPDAPAVIAGDGVLTYDALNARANQLAYALRALGVAPDARVALCLDRSVDLIVALLAVLKAGGAYVPLDPTYPAERLRYMLSDSEPVVVMTRGPLRKIVAEWQATRPAAVPVIDVEADAPSWRDHPVANPSGAAIGLTPAHLAYVIYTSGSTGEAKGVAVTHANVVHSTQARHEAYEQPPASYLLLSPISFDSSVAGLFWTLTTGGALHLPPADMVRDPVALTRYLRQGAISHLLCLPSLYTLLLDESEPSGGLPSVRVVIVAGERCPASLLARHDAVAPEAVLYNEYGPTEATVWSTVHRHRRGECRSPVPIGRPIANARVYILDSHHAPVPVGVVGELYIGGAGVARGYLKRPALTASRFVADPFVGEIEPHAGRMYKTGDLGRWLSDGAIEFVGRNDFQVKIRGFRIEPGEIEAQLLELPGVREAVVVAREDTVGDQRLVAYYTTSLGTGADHHDEQVDAETLRTFLASRVPEYMVPSAFVILEHLPLTPNGKLDVKALPMPVDGSTTDRYVAPRTPVEELLAGIWADVLQVDRVSTSDSFFALGGHSLRAIRIVSRLRETFGVELPVRALFEQPTLGELAACVEAARRTAAPVLPPVTPAARTAALPLSFAQERLWFLDRLEPGSPVYNVPVALRLEGALNSAALEHALGEIVRRHETLRTTFAETDTTPIQVIAPFRDFTLPVEDLTGMAPAAREAEVQRRVQQAAVQPFDLAAGPLLRAALLRLSAAEHVLLLTQHHIVTDGWSLGVLFRELSSAYAACRAGQAPSLPALHVQYADYALWQRAYLADRVLARDLTYWQTQLADLPELLPLPTDSPRPALQTYRGAATRVELSSALREQLEVLARREGVTLYMVLLAAFQVLLGKYAGTADVTVGSPIAGRPRRELEDIIGFFVNTLVLRTDLSGDPRLRDVLHRVRHVTLAAYEHQDLPFEQLVAALQPVRSLSHSPLFQVMFVLHDGDEPGLALPGVQVRRVAAESVTEKFDLSLALTPHPGGLRGRLAYRTDLFEASTIARMLQQFERVLEQLIADPDRRLSEVSLLDAAERQLVVDTWNQTDVDYPADRCIHELFEEQAAERSGAIAVVCGDQTLTYAALDARATRVAEHLIALGVGPDVRVGLCVDRSLSLLVAVLGVLKAGGAYVPLEAHYPADRLAFMVADMGVTVLLTDEQQRATLPMPPGVAIVTVEAAAGTPVTHAGARRARRAEPASLAFVIYTSGSTGQPKGVGIEHRGAVRLVRGANYVRFAAGEPMLHAASMAFDASTLELWGPLLNGGYVVLAPSGTPPELDALAATVARHHVTTMFLTTALFQTMVEERLESFENVQQLLIGGEAAPPEAVQRVRLRFPALRLINGYGPTECSTYTTCYTVGDSWRGGAVPIGTPISNTRVYVLDAGRQPVPVGVPGELYAGGVGVARGYLGRPALTAERFVPDPFGPTPGARLYRTGDRVRWRADGTLDYLGRLDAQVKVRGFRIEPGEVEAAIAAYPGVRDVRVMAREDTPGDRRLVAYVVGGVEVNALRAHLQRGLPDYMVPTTFVHLEALPLTPTGKLDVKALPAPQYARGAEFVAPRTDLEETVASVWRSVLAVPEVGTRSNFFDLGGTSLQLIRVHRRLREIRGDLRITDLFRYTTVEDLAVHLGAAAEAARPDTSGLAQSRSRAKERRAALRVKV